MGDGVLGVDEGRDAGVLQEVSRRILFASLALVENHPHVNAALVSLDQGLGNRGDW